MACPNCGVGSENSRLDTATQIRSFPYKNAPSSYASCERDHGQGITATLLECSHCHRYLVWVVYEHGGYFIGCHFWMFVVNADASREWLSSADFEENFESQSKLVFSDYSHDLC